jgi:hypothetical protein
VNKEQWLESIIRQSPGDTLMLRIDVLYGADDSNRYTMAGYKYPNKPIVTLAYQDRFKFTDAEMQAALKRAGWTQEGRPSKQGGLAYHYFYKRIPQTSDALAGDPLPFVFTTDSLSYEEAERKRQARLFATWMDDGDATPH